VAGNNDHPRVTWIFPQIILNDWHRNHLFPKYSLPLYRVSFKRPTIYQGAVRASSCLEWIDVL
jgi:hypothetical protein